MPIIQFSCSAPSPAIVALEVMSKLQEANVSFTSDVTPSFESVTNHPIAGPSTIKSVSWVGCTRAISGLVPSLGLWEGPMVESWVDAAANTLLPILQGGRFHMGWSSLLCSMALFYHLVILER
jgi:hypothetical protein